MTTRGINGYSSYRPKPINKGGVDQVANAIALVAGSAVGVGETTRMKYSSGAFIHSKDVEVEHVDAGVKRQMLGYNDSLMVVRVEFDKGAEGYVHAHPHSQVSYVESGEFDVFIDGVRKRLGPGDSFCVDPHVDHGAVCRESGVLLDVFNPAREDFLEEEGS